MEFSEYVKRLKKVSVNDIKEIIDESLKENDDVSFGFREQRGFIFFGKFRFAFFAHWFRWITPYYIWIKGASLRPPSSPFNLKNLHISYCRAHAYFVVLI